MTKTSAQHFFPAATGLSLVAVVAALMSGCAVPPGGRAGGQTPPSMDTRPAERAATPGETSLAEGIQLYQGGQYAEAEKALQLALRQGLSIGPDRASAHKYLAFIYCTSKREALCSSAFKAARQADPSFALTKAESGHPMWGPVYRRAVPNP